MTKAIAEISAEEFVRMVCGEEAFSVDFVRSQKEGRWLWEVQLNLPCPVLEKAFLRLFQEYIVVHEKTAVAEVSMTIPSQALQAPTSVKFDFQNAYFYKAAQRRLRDEFMRALDFWTKLQKILATAWEDGLLKGAVNDRKLLEKFDGENRFEISPYREGVIKKLHEVLAQIAAQSTAGNQAAGNSAVACLSQLDKYWSANQWKNRQRAMITDRAGSVISLCPEVYLTF